MKNKILLKMFSFVMAVSLLAAQPVYAEENFTPDNSIQNDIKNGEFDISDLKKVPDKQENENEEAEDENLENRNIENENTENDESADGSKIINDIVPEDSTDEDIAVHVNSPYAITVALNNQQTALTLAPQKFELCPNSKNVEDIKQNTNNLQAVIDAVADAGGGSVTIPLGTYYFYPSNKNYNESDSILTSEDVNYMEYHVIKCRDNVTVNGTLKEDNAVGTILCPIANLAYPVDMFYFADLIDRVENKYDTTQAKWLVNADFNNFVIDYSATVNYGHYNAKGKGFFIVLLKDCDWNNVTVKYTDGTGFGVDCPINCTIKNSTAIACGKQATSESVGGSGFGIGFGYSNEESMLIENCLSVGNRKFGFFFENQARFENYYQAETSNGFVVKNCTAIGNLYNFGGEMCSNTHYIDCVSERRSLDSNLLNITNKCAYYFGTKSTDYHIIQNGTEINKYAANKEYYTDVNGWFVSDGWFEKILQTGIMYGYTDTNGELTYVFGQEDSVTRGQLALMLYRYCYPDREICYVENTTPFIDNISKEYYTEAMNWAYEQGIFTGYKNADGSLSKYIRPNNNISREELATVFYRFAGKNGANVSSYDMQAYKNAPDAKTVSFWANDAVAWCYSNKIMTGGGLDKRLSPLDDATRSQAAKMILQMLNTIP